MHANRNEAYHAFSVESVQISENQEGSGVWIQRDRFVHPFSTFLGSSLTILIEWYDLYMWFCLALRCIQMDVRNANVDGCK